MVNGDKKTGSKSSKASLSLDHAFSEGESAAVAEWARQHSATRCEREHLNRKHDESCAQATSEGTGSIRLGVGGMDWKLPLLNNFIHSFSRFYYESIAPYVASVKHINAHTIIPKRLL